MAGVEKVQYEMSVNDMLTGKLQNADAAAKGLETSIGGVKSMLGALGVGFAVFQGLSFVSSAVEGFHNLKQANAQLEAGLESTAGAAGMTMDELKAQQKELTAATLYSKAGVADLQAQLLTFGGVTKDNFKAITQATMDISSRTGFDIHSLAIQMGKAMDNPSEGLTKLMRQGVMFSQQQKDRIDKLVEQGHIEAAQMIMLTEIQNKYGLSAQHAFDADPLARYNKLMGSFKMAIGEVGEELTTTLAPALEQIGHGFVKVGQYLKEGMDFLKQHGAAIKLVAEAVGFATAAYVAYNLVLKANLLLNGLVTFGMGALSVVMSTVALATGELTAAQWMLNVAMDANPIGLVIAGITALAFAVYEAYQHFATFRGIIWGTWGAIKEFGNIVTDVVSGVYHAWHGMLTGNTDEMTAGLSKAADAYINAGSRITNAAKKGYHEGVADFNASAATTEPKTAKKVDTKGATGKDGKAAEDLSPKKATGTKSITINISINNLVKEFKINTTNMQESMGKAHDLVANTLLSAVNDAGLVANL